MCDSVQINRVKHEVKPQFILFYADISVRRARFNSQLGFKVRIFYVINRNEGSIQINKRFINAS